MVYEQEESDSDDYCLMVESVNSVYHKESPKKIFATMVVKETSVKFQLDSGATVNILPVEIYHEVQKDPELKHLKNTQSTLVMFNNSELKPLGTVELQTRNPKNGECYLIEYIVMALYPRQISSCALNFQVLALKIMFIILKSTFEYKTVSLRLTSYLSLITPKFQSKSTNNIQVFHSSIDFSLQQ